LSKKSGTTEDRNEKNISKEDIENLNVENNENLEKNETIENSKNEEKDNVKNENSEIKNEEKEVSEIEKLKNELEETKDSLLRLSAEYQNFRKRVVKEKEDIYKYANEKLMVDLLPVVDNFDRGFSNLSDDVDKALLEGIELIRKSLKDFLDKNGVKEIEALDKPFDHDKHHAVMTEEKEGIKENIVIEEFQKGYEMNGKVIRHSMVKVSS